MKDAANAARTASTHLSDWSTAFMKHVLPKFRSPEVFGFTLPCCCSSWNTENNSHFVSGHFDCPWIRVIIMSGGWQLLFSTYCLETFLAVASRIGRHSPSRSFANMVLFLCGFLVNYKNKVWYDAPVKHLQCWFLPQCYNMLQIKCGPHKSPVSKITTEQLHGLILVSSVSSHLRCSRKCLRSCSSWPDAVSFITNSSHV